jgi:hypothetical protein
MGKAGLENRTKTAEAADKAGNYLRYDWDSFLTAFAEDNWLTGKAYTVGIEGSGIGSGGLSGEPAVFPRSSSIIGKPSIWLSTTSIMASFNAYHTFWITSRQ